MSGIHTIDLRHAVEADAAFERHLAELSERNPGLFDASDLSLTKEQLRQIARTFFYLGFAAGESIESL